MNRWAGPVSIACRFRILDCGPGINGALVADTTNLGTSLFNLALRASLTHVCECFCGGNRASDREPICYVRLQ